jgi:CheY-like chemotaxis protein
MSLGTLVIAEDDATLRMMVVTILQKAGFTVLAASDGAEAWNMVQRVRPNLVVSDVQMPKLDGVALLAQIRAHADLSTTPVILLTSLSERSHMRAGMANGADDYLTKPFLPQDLTEAVMAQLRKHASRSAKQTKVVQAAVKTALDSQRHNLATVYERRLRKELSGSLWQNDAAQARDDYFEQASVLYVDLVSDAWPQLVPPAELARLLRLAYSNASDAVNLFGAHAVHMVGEGLLALFVPTGDTASMTHQRRALKSALALIRSSARVQQHIDQHHAGLKLPPFEMSVAVHSGPVTLARLNDSLNMEKPSVMPVGSTIKGVMLMQREAAMAQMGLVASEAALLDLIAEVSLGRGARIPGSTGDALAIAEVLDWRDPAAAAADNDEPDGGAEALPEIDWDDEGQTMPAELTPRAIGGDRAS